jgi:hypothetical protein
MVLILFAGLSLAEENPVAINNTVNYKAAFHNAALAMFSDQTQFHDPHALKTLGLIKKELVAEFGQEKFNYWLDHALAEACLINAGNSWAEAHVFQPVLPALPTCGFDPSLHFTSEFVLGLDWNNITEIRRQSFDREIAIPREKLVQWIKSNINIDDWSPGMESQALIEAGVAFNESWKTSGGMDWSLEMLIDADIQRWRENRNKTNITAGSIVPENMLHLAPSLIALMKSRPDLIPRYYPVLEEIFAVYESALHPDGYWGFPGEACCTGHIIEQFVLAGNAGMNVTMPSLRPVEIMVEHQYPNGWFDLHNANFVGAQSHGLRALSFTMPLLERRSAAKTSSSS